MKFGKRNVWMKVLAFTLALTLAIPWGALAESAPDETSQAAEMTEEMNAEEVPVTGKGSGEEGTVFSPSGFLGDYTVSFYQVDPENEEVPDNNLIEEYTGIAFGTRFSEQIKELEEDHPEYKDVEWTIEDAEITNNLAVWTANGENAAQIGENTYPALQAAIDAVKDGTAGGSKILLLKDVEENIFSEGVDYTLDMQGHTISPAPEESEKRVYTINGGSVILKNGKITGGKVSGAGVYGAGLAVLSGANVKAEYLTITENEQTSEYGGGMYINGAVVDMQDCSVSENTAASDGGGIYMENNAVLTAGGLTVSGNKATDRGTWGGGICLSSSQLTLTDSDITGNSCKAKGGGVYAEDSAVSFNGGKIENNISGTINNRGGAGIGGGGAYVEEGSFEANGLVVKNNMASGSGYTDAGGLALETESIVLTNVEISENKSNGVGGLAVSAGNRWNPASFLAENCRICDNEGSSVMISGAYIRAYNVNAPAELRNCTFSGNRLGTTLYVETGDLKLTGCRITDNDAGIADYGEGPVGGIEGAIGWGAPPLLILEDTVVTGNVGQQAGGIYGNVQMSGGALYGNIATGGSGANDLKICVDYIDEKVFVPKITEMADGEQKFDGFVWKDSAHKIKLDSALDATSLSEEKIAEIPDATYPELGWEESLYFTAGPPYRYVAEVTGAAEPYPEYESMMDAIWNSGAAWDEAKANTVRMIAGESDHSGFVVPESIDIGPGMIVPIDMNGRTLKSTSESAIRIMQNGELILSGAEGSTVLAGSGSKAVVNEGSLTVNAPILLSGIEHTGTMLALLNGAKVSEIKLGKGSVVTADEKFNPEELIFEIDNDELASLNNWENAGAKDEVTVTLLTPAQGSALPDDLSKKITITGANGLVSVEKDEHTGNIVACTISLNGVYVDGVKGDDANPGTHDQPVKTFERAKEALKALIAKQQAEGVETARGIYVLGTVTVDSSEQWSLKDDLQGMKLMREPSFTGSMVNVKGSNAELSLSDMIIDGMGDKTTAADAMVKVNGGSRLVIADGAVLTNNKSRTYYGGGVFADHATVEMTGGEISGNYGKNGGGVGLRGASMTVSGGTIKDNTAEVTGGGVGVFEDSSLEMSDSGVITGNEARYGGGICVGGNTTITVGTGKGKLTMKGGEISGNTSRAEGGGIYVQCQNTAEITGGKICGNESCSGHFGGGGIYVNGTRNVDGTNYKYGTLYLTNALITENSAARGGGVAGCSSSTVKVYQINGAAIYNNTAGPEYGANIFIADYDYGWGEPEYFISEYMPDGTPYHWVDRNNNLVPSNYLRDTYKTIHLNNNVSGTTMEPSVLITDNTAEDGGGGIGTNGFVQIGQPGETEIPVVKKWDDNEREDIRPDYVDIWLVRNDDERVAFLRFEKNEDGSWPETLSFKNQPLTDSNGTPYAYKIVEEMPVKEDNSGYPYEATITGDAESGFTVTNTYAPKAAWTPKGSKTLNGRAMEAGEFKFTVKENGKAVSRGSNKAAAAGVAADIVFEEISYSLEDVGQHIYTITEEQTDLPEDVTADPRSYVVAVQVEVMEDGNLAVTAEYQCDTKEVRAADFVNTYEKKKIWVSFDKVDAQAGTPVAGAVLRVVDMDGRKIDEWTTDGKTHTIGEGLDEGATYRLVEVSAPEGYEIAEDVVFTADSQTADTPIVMKDKKKEVRPQRASVRATKRLSLNGDPLAATDETFYVALYEDADCTRRVTEIKPVVFKRASASTVTFDNLEVGKTYYVGECDANGNVILTGTVGDDAVFMATFHNGNEARVDKNGGSTTVEFENELFTIPEGYYKVYELTVTKKLLNENGEAVNSDETFYAGIFEDEACTVLTDKTSDNIIALELDGNSEVSKTVCLDYLPGSEVTLYIAEVDANGNLVEGTDGFGYSVTYDTNSVVYNDSQLRNSVTITNTEEVEQETEETEEETEKKTQKETEKPKDTNKQAAKTGDNTTIALYIMLLCAAGAVLFAGYRKRRKEVKK